MQLGFFLKRYRKAVHLSGKQLASKIGITSHALEKYENAGIMPGYEAASKLQRFFGLTNLKDIPESELTFCVEHSFTIPGMSSRASKGKMPEVENDNFNESDYKLIIKRKDKKIAELEELINILKDQINTIRREKL